MKTATVLRFALENLLEKSECKVETSRVQLGSVRELSLIDTLKVLAAAGGVRRWC